MLCVVHVRRCLRLIRGFNFHPGKFVCFTCSRSKLPHIKKWELVEGDATKTFSEYVQKHPELIVALAYFDFDIYAPTKACLELLLSRLTKGSIVVFDELNCPEFPGETIAVQEIIGINNIALRRDPNDPYVSWFRWE